MRREMAEDLAVAALGWMAGEPDVLGAFLVASGLAPADLRRRAAEPEVLGAVLDFVLQEDARVLAVAGVAGVPPADLVAARAALPGGDLPHWT
jgi:hypothetical protein